MCRPHPDINMTSPWNFRPQVPDYIRSCFVSVLFVNNGEIIK